MGRLRLLLAVLFCAAGLGPAAAAEIAVIVNRASPVGELTPRMVSDLYLGRSRAFPSGDPCMILDHPAESPLRERFFARINGMSLKQLNAYWARLRFSGEVLPPARLADSRAVLEAVRHDRLAIGYVDAAVVDATVQVVLRLRD